MIDLVCLLCIVFFVATFFNEEKNPHVVKAETAFGCEGTTPGTIAAVCCPNDKIVPDGEGTWKAPRCSGSYVTGFHPGDGSPEGWETRNNW